MSVKQPIKCEDGRHIPFEAGDFLPPEVINVIDLLVAGEGIEIVDNGDGTVTINNTCCEGPPDPSVHTILSIVANMASVVGGGVASWTVTIDSPVTVSPLYISLVLTGAEQVDHSYPYPSLVIPVGQSFGIVAVPTDADAGVDETNALCLNAVVGYRIDAVPPSPVCLNVVDTTEPVQTVSVAYQGLVSGSYAEGDTGVVRVTSSAVAPGGGISGNLAFSGSEKIAHPGDYPDKPYTILAGNTFVDVNVPITAVDGSDPTTALGVTMTVATGGWSVYVGVDNAAILNADGGGGGGGCFSSGTFLRTPTGYRPIEGLGVGSRLTGFYVDGMVDESDPFWYAWKTTSIASLKLLDVIIHGYRAFTAPIAIRINGGPLVTPDHRYFAKKGTKYGWHQAKDLDKTYKIVSDGALIPVRTVETLEDLFTFYAIDVENVDTIIAQTAEGDFFAHNRKCADCPEGGDPA